MSKKSKVNLDGIPKEKKKALENTDAYKEGVGKGLANSRLYEGIPNFIKAPSEHVINNENNSWIVLGRDSPSN